MLCISARTFMNHQREKPLKSLKNPSFERYSAGREQGPFDYYLFVK